MSTSYLAPLTESGELDYGLADIAGLNMAGKAPAAAVAALADGTSPLIPTGPALGLPRPAEAMFSPARPSPGSGIDAGAAASPYKLPPTPLTTERTVTLDSLKPIKGYAYNHEFFYQVALFFIFFMFFFFMLPSTRCSCTGCAHMCYIPYGRLLPACVPAWRLTAPPSARRCRSRPSPAPS